jgi:hypothetical protein
MRERSERECEAPDIAEEDTVMVLVSSFSRDGQTAFRARGKGFQGLAVVSPSQAQAKCEAAEVVIALRRARGHNRPCRIVFVEN